MCIQYFGMDCLFDHFGVRRVLHAPVSTGQTTIKINQILGHGFMQSIFLTFDNVNDRPGSQNAQPKMQHELKLQKHCVTLA